MYRDVIVPRPNPPGLTTQADILLMTVCGYMISLQCPSIIMLYVVLYLCYGK